MDLCVFTITDDRLVEVWILDAHYRGVRVRIITDNDKAADLGSDIDQLPRGGDRRAGRSNHRSTCITNSRSLNLFHAHHR